MIKDIRLHGFVSDTAERYEYNCTVMGPGLHTRFFYEQGDDVRGARDRFFMAGNEIAFYGDQIYHRGNGGTFCEYMLGVEQPVKDILKPDVRNRLVMYGARYDAEGERIIFSNDTSGHEHYSRVFDEGHAFANYFFFIAGDIQGELKTVQETVLRFTGKQLKRSDLSSDRDGSELAARLYHDIGIPRWTLFIIKLTDRYALDYLQKFSEFYVSGQALDKQRLDELAAPYKLNPSQRERIEMDQLQKQPDNRQIVDAYRESLVARYLGRLDEQAAQLKRSRLRSQGAQRQLPALLFDIYDCMLPPRNVAEVAPPACITEARRCLEELLMPERAARGLDEEDLICLLRSRLDALQQHNSIFEEMVSEVGNERLKAHGQGPVSDLFKNINGHFERFESSYEIVNSVAFIDDYELTEEQMLLLARTKDIIENVRAGLFDELIFKNIERQRYLNNSGRERLHKLKAGIDAIIIGEGYPGETVSAIKSINNWLRQRREVEACLRTHVRDIYKEPLGKQEQESLRAEITEQLISDGVIGEPVSNELFAAALHSIREEFLYIDEMLPQIIKNRDRNLRKDFLENSELDRFRTEEIEQQYFRTHKLGQDVIDWFANETKG